MSSPSRDETADTKTEQSFETAEGAVHQLRESTEELIGDGFLGEDARLTVLRRLRSMFQRAAENPSTLNEILPLIDFLPTIIRGSIQLFEDTEAEKAKLQKRTRQLDMDKTQLTVRIEFLKVDNQGLENDLAALRQDCNKKHDDIVAIKDENLQQLSTIVALTERCRELRQTITQLQTERSNVQKETGKSVAGGQDTGLGDAERAQKRIRVDRE